MKKAMLLVLMFSLPIIGYSQNRPDSVGVGVGPLYNGFGMGYQISTSSVNNFISVGCPGIGYGGDSGVIVNCGIGYSLVITPISDDKKHGFGVNIGAGYSRRGVDTDPYYIVGLNYAHFYNGIEKKGWNAQIGPALQYLRGYYSPIGLFGFGYQF